MRDITPKDFYVDTEIERQSFEYYYYLICKSCNISLDTIKIIHIKAIVRWWLENIFSSLDLETWYQTAFFLLHGRWGSDFDWLENQPFSKIKQMVSTTNTHAGKFM